MVNTKKSNCLLALLLVSLSLNTYSMETPEPKKIGWVALAGATILGGVIAYRQFLSYVHAEPIKPFNFGDLPTDTQETIIALLAQHTSAKTLKEVAQTINALSQTNKYLYKLINDPDFCLQIIKNLAQKFKCSDETAAKALQTQRAKQILELQEKLYDLTFLKLPNKYYIDAYFKAKPFESLLKEGIDLEFTYNFPRENPQDFVTPLMLAIISGTNPFIINKLSSMGDKYININRKSDKKVNTALLYAIEKYNTSLYRDAMNRLLYAGADPELANNDGLTPLQAAQQTGNQEIINLIQDVIEIKYEKK